MAKDCVLYRFVRDAFAPLRTGTDPLAGARGVVEKALDPHGLVRLRGELWQAEPLRLGRPIAADMPVVIRAIRGLTLLVEADDMTAPSSELHPPEEEHP